MSNHPKNAKILKWTNNNKHFNRARMKCELKGQQVCYYCAPFDGENYMRGYYKRNGHRSWKRYRRYQWKV